MPHTFTGNREKFIERRARAWELRKAGASLRAIAREMGYSRDTAQKDIQHEARILITRTQETAEEARRLDSERLDSMLLSLAPKIREGNIAAIGQGVRILERRAKMFGYDAPVQVDMAAVVTSVDAGEIRQRVAAKLAAFVASVPEVIEVQAIPPEEGSGGNGHGRLLTPSSTG